MKEKPILFSAPMVRAILDGTKTQTRRVIKPQPEPKYRYLHRHVIESTDVKRKRGDAIFGDAETHLKGNLYHVRCPYLADQLWVRETWQYNPYGGIVHKAGSGIINCDGRGWRPSIHMPRWASRITLTVKKIRVERVQDITEEDAIRAGIERSDSDGLRHWPYLGVKHPIKGTSRVYPTARQAFESIWDSINSKAYQWEFNPWVWVIEFEVTA